MKSSFNSQTPATLEAGPEGGAGGASIFGGFDRTRVKPIGHDLLVARLHLVRDDGDRIRAHELGQIDARLGLEQQCLKTSWPVMPSLAASHWILSSGVRLERSAEGWRTLAVTPSTRLTEAAI